MALPMSSRLSLRSRNMGILIVIILAMSYVGMTGIGADSIWLDEYLSLYYAGGMADETTNVVDVVSRIVERESGQSPIYYVLLSIWGKLAGFSVFSARYFSLLCGLMSLAWVYRLGTDLHSPFAGLCAAIILGGSAFFGIYLHEIRVYTLFVLEILLVIWLYWRVLYGKASWLLSSAFLLSASISLYSHPFAVVTIAALGLYHVVLATRRTTWRKLLALLILSGILFFPWTLPTFFKVVAIAERGPVSAAVESSLAYDLAQAFSNGWWLFWLLPFFSLRRARTHTGLRMLLLVGLTSCVVMVVVYQVSYRINHIRYMLPLFPVFALLCGIGCASLTNDRRPIVAILAVWCATGYLAAPTFANQFYLPHEPIALHVAFPFAEVLGEIKNDAVANDAIALEFPFHAWAIRGVTDYYLKGSAARYVLTDNLVQGELESQTRIAGFEHFLGDAGRVYFVVDRTVAPSEELIEYEKILSARYVTCDRLWDTDTVRVDKLAQIDALCGPPQTPIEQFGDSVALLDFVHMRTDDFDVFYSIWSTEEPMESHSQAIHFRKEDGELVYQIDAHCHMANSPIASTAFHEANCLRPRRSKYKVSCITGKPVSG